MTDKAAVDGKPAIYLSGLFPEEISDLLDFGQSFRAKQVYDWIVRGSGDFAAMSNLPSPRTGRGLAHLRQASILEPQLELKEEMVL